MQFDAGSTEHPHTYNAILEARDGQESDSFQAEVSRWLKDGPPTTPSPTQPWKLGLVAYESPGRAVTRAGPHRKGVALSFLFAPLGERSAVIRILTLAKAAGAAILRAPGVLGIDALQDLDRDSLAGREAEFWFLVLHRLAWAGLQPAIASRRWLWIPGGPTSGRTTQGRLTLAYKPPEELKKLSSDPAYGKALQLGDRYFALMDLDVFAASALACEMLISLSPTRGGGVPEPLAKSVSTDGQQCQPRSIPPIVALFEGLRNLGFQCRQLAGLFRDLEGARRTAPSAGQFNAASFQEATELAALMAARHEAPRRVPAETIEVAGRLIEELLSQAKRANEALRVAHGQMNQALNPGSMIWSIACQGDLDAVVSACQGLAVALQVPNSISADHCERLETLAPRLDERFGQVTAVMEQGSATGNDRPGVPPGPPAKPAVPLKTPPEKAFIAWRVRFLQGITNQTEIAREMTTAGFPANQGQVSRWLRDVERFLEAGGQAPEMPQEAKPAAFVDPDDIEIGEEQHGRSRYQRGRRDEDGDDD